MRLNWQQLSSLKNTDLVLVLTGLLMRHLTAAHTPQKTYARRLHESLEVN